MMKSKILFGLFSVTLAASCVGDAEVPKAEMSKRGLVPAALGEAGPDRSTKAAQAFTVATMEATGEGGDRVEAGRAVAGTLSSSDPRFSDGSYYDTWFYDAPESQDVMIEMTSVDFDVYLVLASGRPGAGFEVLAAENGVRGSTGARIRFRLAPGPYTIHANSFRGGETGGYQLSINEVGAASTPGAPRVLEDGSAGAGELDPADRAMQDGSFFETWTYHGQAGEQLTVSLSSGEFDSFLMIGLGNAGRFELLAEDDDGGGGLNAMITLILPETGPYTIVANSYSEGETGRYSVSANASVAPALMSFEERFPGGGDPNGRYALLVGIDDYPGTESDLSGPVDDAELMRDVLVGRYGFREENIVMLTDADANRETIANAFVRHLGQAGPDGVAVFFYSGHGMQLDDNRGLTAPLDPEDDDEALYVWGRSSESSVILDDELGYLAGQLRAERTLIIVDACFSGTISRGPGQSKEVHVPDVADYLRLPKSFITAELDIPSGPVATGLAIEDVFAQPQRHSLWAASSEEQVSWAIGSWPDRDGPASLFTYFLVRALSQSSSDATFSTIHQEVDAAVTAYVASNPSLQQQDAQLLGPFAEVAVEEFLSRR